MPETEAFCGTFHIDEGYEEMNVSYEQASQRTFARQSCRPRSIATRSPTTAFSRPNCERKDSTP